MYRGYHSAINRGYDSSVVDVDTGLPALAITDYGLDKYTAYVGEMPLAHATWAGGATPYNITVLNDWDSTPLFNESATYSTTFSDIPIGQNNPPLGVVQATLFIQDANGISVSQVLGFTLIEGRPTFNVNISAANFAATANIDNIVSGTNGGSIFDVTIDWGDSVFDSATVDIGGIAFNHTYLEPSVFNIVINVTDTANNQTRQYTQPLEIPALE